MTGALLGNIPNANSGFSNIHFKSGVLWAGSTVLYSSNDSGVNWTQLPNFNLGGGRITEINFFDKVNGVVGATTGVFKTVNGGNTWTKILAANPCYSAEFAGSTSAIVAACDNNGFYYSSDGGTTWKNYNPGTHSMLVLAYPDGTMYGFGGGVGVGKLVKTVDQGTTWTNVSTIDYDSWSIARDSDASTIYLLNEEGHVTTDSKASVIKSVNFGGTWQKLTSYTPQYYSGSISVATCAIYSQSLSNGVLRSTDKGVTWQSIGGPNNFIDTRLVCAIDNNIVIAADGTGNIWRTINSGGVPITVNSSFSYFTLAAKPSITTCQQDSVLVIISAENACFPRDVVISYADITGTGSNSFSVNLTTPLTIFSGTIDTILVGFNQLHITGPISAKLHLIGYLTNGTTQTPFDTLITVQISVTTTGPSIKSDVQTLAFNNRTGCDDLSDSIIHLTNTGCDTLRLIDGPGNISPAFYAGLLKFPIIIPPDSTISIPIYFDPPVDGNYSALAQFFASQQGFTKQLNVTLLGKRNTGSSKLISYDTTVIFKPISICDPSSDTTVTITNTSCDTIRIFSGPIGWRPEFSTDTLTYPIIIPPGGTFQFTAHFHSSNNGGFGDTGIFIAGRDNYSNDPPINIPVVLKGSSSSGSSPSPVLNSQVNFGIVSACDSVRDTTVTFTNFGCDTLRILSGPGNIDPSFEVEGLTFPIVIPPDSSIVIHFHFHASASGNYQTQATYKTQRSGSKPENVVLTLNGKNNGNPGGPIVGASSYIFDTISLCAPSSRDTSIVFSNHGCDTLYILSGPGNLGNGFGTDQLTYPIIIPPDSSVTIVFHFTPTTSGDFKSYPHFVTERSGQQGALDLFLQGSATAGGSIFSLVTPSLAFTPLSICATDSLDIVYTNIGCDSVFVTPVGISGDIDFSAPKSNEAGVASGDSIRIKVVLLPTRQGQRSATYLLHLRDRNGVTRDTQITITGLITPGLKTLKLSDSVFSFGQTTLCASPDTIITLYNRGCDTLWVNDLTLSGSGFSINESTPFYILPGENQKITVHTLLDTTGERLTSNGVLTIASNSQDPLPPIVLTRGYVYPKSYSIRLEMPTTRAGSGDTVVVKIIADSLPSDVTTITAAYQIANTDLLSYVSTVSDNIVTLTPTDITLTGTPIKAKNKVIAELKYAVFLTKDSTTSLSLSNAHFNPADISYERCIATVTAAGDAFNYEFACGEHLVRGVLRGEVLTLLSISPNPTTGGIAISIQSPNEQVSQLEVYDMLGKAVVSEHLDLKKGKNSLSLDSKAFARGMYSVVLRSSSGSVTTTFVKE
ncbi:MAG TPA: T9SS type A sorting domain-containing protein [Candidatus Kapabacteria bacterium]|nr:T9SS type A sorting domain-containing protein [Candidatus Kapabacteria bacterium]